MHVTRISHWLAAGSHPSPSELEALRNQGFETVIDVRSETEARAEASAEPREQGARVRALGMEYAHVPLSLGELDAATLDCFVKQLAWLPKPAYVSSPHGRRAALAGLVSAAIDAGMPGGETLERAAALGLLVDDDVETVRSYVDAQLGAANRSRKS